MMKGHLRLLEFYALLLLTGCGYHFENKPNQLAFHYRSVAVPYVQGDLDGRLTDALIKAIALSHQFTYAKEGELILEASLASDSVSHIGWQYDRDPLSGDRINRLVPNEGRLELTVNFSLISSRTGKVIHGPITVSADSDFDFVDSDSLLDISFLTPSGRRQSTLFFSLGQLDSMQGAQKSAKEPAFHQLAYKIVKGIENISWNLD